MNLGFSLHNSTSWCLFYKTLLFGAYQLRIRFFLLEKNYQHVTIFNTSFCLKSSQYQLSFGWSVPAIEKFSFFLFYHGNTMSFLYILIFHNNFTFGLILSSSFGLYAKSSSKCSSVLVFISCSPVLSRHCKCKLTYAVLIRAT